MKIIVSIGLYKEDKILQMLSRKELGRYSRQIIFPDFDRRGQEKLKNSHVLIAGVGGLGSLFSTYLTRAGIGHITIVDNECIQHSTPLTMKSTVNSKFT